MVTAGDYGSKGWFEIDTEIGIGGGIHARPTEAVFDHCRQYPHRIRFVYEGREVDAKNIVDLFSLNGKEGGKIRIKVSREFPGFEEVASKIAEVLMDRERKLCYEHEHNPYQYDWGE